VILVIDHSGNELLKFIEKNTTKQSYIGYDVYAAHIRGEEGIWHGYLPLTASMDSLIRQKELAGTRKKERKRKY